MMKDQLKMILTGLLLLLSFSLFSTQAASDEPLTLRYGTEKIEGLDIFYREVGNPNNPAIVLLHGFPTSSHMYRNLMRELASDYYLIAPDYPGFGSSSFPDPSEFDYTFTHIAEIMEKFIQKKQLSKFALFVQDYGAPIGFRLAQNDPKRVTGIISQNGNIYQEGINPAGWGPVLSYWRERTTQLEQTIIQNVFSLEGLKWQYTHGTKHPKNILPDNWLLDFVNMSRPGQHQMHLDLFYDYQNNVSLYPQWQKYLRDNQPPLLIVWGQNDAFFRPEGAHAFKKDVKDIDFNLLDTGHFALEEDYHLISNKVKSFLGARLHK